jgi:hypothetical protein
MNINRDFAAYRRRLLAEGARLETRDGPDLGKLSATIDGIGRAFEEFKSANDARLAEIGKKGAADPLIEEKLTRINASLDELAEIKKRLEAAETRAARPGGAGTREGADTETPEQRNYRKLFLRWARNPSDPARQMELRGAQKVLESKAGNVDDDGFEMRAVQTVTSTGSAGGFALPEVIERQIARLSVDISPIRQIATVRTVGSPDYKELFDVNGAAFEWLAEAATRNQTNTPDLAEVAPTFGMASARPRASEESLDDLFFDVESWLTMSAAEAIAQGEGAGLHQRQRHRAPDRVPDRHAGGHGGRRARLRRAAVHRLRCGGGPADQRRRVLRRRSTRCAPATARTRAGSPASSCWRRCASTARTRAPASTCGSPSLVHGAARELHGLPDHRGGRHAGGGGERLPARLRGLPRGLPDRGPRGHAHDAR